MSKKRDEGATEEEKKKGEFAARYLNKEPSNGLTLLHMEKLKPVAVVRSISILFIKVSFFKFNIHDRGKCMII